jgi:diaminopimelate epimerase
VARAAESVSLVKMNGTKNDFIVLDERPPRFQDYAGLARRWCDRTSGIGADGLLVVLPPSGTGVATMHIYNADGSEAEMCGNGARCVARYLWEEGQGEHFSVDTLAGPVTLDVEGRAHDVMVRVDVGVPTIVRAHREGAALEALGSTWRYGHVTLGNPHIVVFVDDVSAVYLERLGAMLATHPRFSGGINVNIAHTLDRHALAVRHYERGVGITQACGTGAVAASVVAVEDGRVASPVHVHVPGGILEVEWERGGRAYLSGTAEVEFERTLESA